MYDYSTVHINANGYLQLLQGYDGMSEDEQMAIAIQMSLQTPGMYFTYVCACVCTYVDQFSSTS